MRENRVLSHITGRLKAPEGPDPTWLLTIFTVLELERYPLEEWNEALSAVLGRKVFCPSYQALSHRLQEAAVEHAARTGCCVQNSKFPLTDTVESSRMFV